MALEHFTLSAQLGPACESRAVARVGGGPLMKIIETQINKEALYEKKQM